MFVRWSRWEKYVYWIFLRYQQLCTVKSCNSNFFFFKTAFTRDYVSLTEYYTPSENILYHNNGLETLHCENEFLFNLYYI